MSSNKKNDKKNIKKFQLPRVLTVFMLLALLIIGLVSTTFASFVADNSTPDDGSLVARVQTAVSANREKKDLADTKANADLADTNEKEDIAQTGADDDLADTSADTDVVPTGANLSKGDVIWYTGSKTHIYVWEDSSETNAAGWPGEELKTDATSGMKYWVSNSDTLFDMCIFSNSGSSQTADLAIGGAGYVHNDSGSTGVFYSNEVTTDNVPFDLLPVLKGEAIMFYIGEPSSWKQSTFYLRSGAGGSTVDSGSYVLTYSNNRYAVVTAPSTTGYYVSHSTSWDGEKLNSAPESGMAYLCNDTDSTSGCATSGSQYTVSAALAQNSISVGNTVTISSSSKSSGNLGRSTSIQYYVKDSNGGFKKLNYSGTTLDTSGLEAGSYTVYPVLFDGYVYTRGDGISLTVNSKYSYTVTYAYGGTVSPESGSVDIGDGVTIEATPYDGYTFVEWTGLSKATLGSTTSASTTLTPTDNGATVKANFRPDAPSALTLTGSPVASGTTGDGTQSNPYIVFENSGFTLTANATVVSGATAYYNSTNNSTDAKDSGQFTPPDTTKGETVSYAVYAWAEAGTYYSTNSKSATAYYMVFSHLNGANTGFTMSSDSITDADILTLSGAYLSDDNIAQAEKAYITQTYQVSTDNSTFSDLGGSTWVPNEIGTYYFRVKTTNTKTGETVYSTSQTLTVTQSTVYYDITVTNDGTVAGTVKLYADGVEITDGKILSNSKLTVSITRPDSNTYIEYLDVDTLTEFDNMYVNDDITDYVAYDHVKGNVEIHYKIVEKPTVTVEKPTNADAISFKYYVDGTLTTKTAAGTYYVDYDSKITYTVTPKSGYYVSAMTGVTIGELKAGAVEGTKSGVTANISSVTATLSNNRTVSVSIDSTSDVKTGASMTIDGVALGFGQPKPLNYGATSTIVITPPDGCYAVVSGNNVEATIDTDGKATFDVTLTGTNKNYTVKFVYNPKIYMVQPQYGSVYVTDGLGNYYFNGDPVGYGTELTVNVKRDHANATVNSVLVNDASIGTADGSKFKIYEDSTATADITAKSGHEFENGTEYGQRRIFFTDNSGWGDGQVMVHYSNTNSNYTFTDGNTMAMTFKYVNDSNQRVYYADIPYNFKYVNFYKKSATSNYTASALINGEANAFWHSGGTSPYKINAWQENYSDFVATDRADTIQQGVTVKGEAATFSYTCDFGDNALKAEVVSGNNATVDFDKGVLSITPTENTQPHTLVKVTSKASTTVKYYLIRVENFEIVDFSGIQKIYRSGIINNIQLDLIVKGGVLNYAADLFVSDSNYADSYEDLTPNKTAGFVYQGSIEAYTNSFLLENYINNGVKFFKIRAKDSANHKATATLKTLFGTNTYNGTRCVYFYNNTGDSISKYDLRACFNSTSDPDKSEHRFVTMQKVGNTNYYRAVVPNGFESSVNFYLANQKTFSNVYADYDGTDDTVETYDYGILGVEIPQTDNANIVYEATEIGANGITGEFIQFDY